MDVCRILIDEYPRLLTVEDNQGRTALDYIKNLSSSSDVDEWTQLLTSDEATNQ